MPLRPRPTPTLGSLALTRVLAAAEKIRNEGVKQDWKPNYCDDFAVVILETDFEELESALDAFERERAPKPAPVDVPKAVNDSWKAILEAQRNGTLHGYPAGREEAAE